MINLKSRVINNEYLVCLCDSELIGRTLKEGELFLKVPESFYGNEQVTEEQALIELKKATIINAIGTNAVNAVKKVVKIDKIITVQGVPHVQVFSIV